VGRVEADLNFHLLLCRLAGNSMLVEAWRNLEGRIRVAIMNGGPDRAPRMMSRDRHAPIVDAIESGDLAEAVRVIDQHMTEAADHFCGPARLSPPPGVDTLPLPSAPPCRDKSGLCDRAFPGPRHRTALPVAAGRAVAPRRRV
jgi:hypothetical protein